MLPSNTHLVFSNYPKSCLYRSSKLCLPFKVCRLAVQLLNAQILTLTCEDVSRLSQTCRLLHGISHSNSRAIANAIDCLAPISSKEAEDLANLQLRFDFHRPDQPIHEHAYNISSAARAIANAISPLVSYCYPEALRLAEEQLRPIRSATHQASQSYQHPACLNRGSPKQA